MTRIAALAAVALLMVACGRAIPTPVATQELELPKADEVAHIEMVIGSKKLRIDDSETIAAALDFLEHELTGWTELSKEPLESGAVKAAFVRKTNQDPCAFFIESDSIIVAGTNSGAEVHASRAAIDRFKSVLGIAAR